MVSEFELLGNLSECLQIFGKISHMNVIEKCICSFWLLPISTVNLFLSLYRQLIHPEPGTGICQCKSFIFRRSTSLSLTVEAEGHVFLL